MAKVLVPGGGVLPFPNWPANALQTGAPTIVGTLFTMNDATDRVVHAGRVRWADGADHDLHIIHWRSGASSLPVLTIRVGPRAVDNMNGPPLRDDGVVAESGTHVDPAQLTNFATVLDSDRPVAHGEILAIVWDIASYTSGSINGPAALQAQTSTMTPHLPAVSTFDGTTWTARDHLPLLTLEADDGTLGLLEGAVPVTSSIAGAVFNSGSSPNEHGMVIQVTAPVYVGSVAILVNPFAGADFDIVLYDDTTPLATVAVDANAVAIVTSGQPRLLTASFPHVLLSPGATYYLAIKPSTANSVRIYVPAFRASGDRKTVGSWAIGYSTREGAAWAATDATKLIWAQLGIVALEQGAAGGIRSGGGISIGL